MLTIDDDPHGREGMRLLLDRVLGHQAHTASTGAEGIALAREVGPVLVFVDLVLLPDTDGYRLAEALRAEIGFHARLVALTGHPRLLHEDPVFDAHLVKPVTRGEIEEQLRLAR